MFDRLNPKVRGAIAVVLWTALCLFMAYTAYTLEFQVDDPDRFRDSFLQFTANIAWFFTRLLGQVGAIIFFVFAAVAGSAYYVWRDFIRPSRAGQ